jgi:hypothetical protein
MNLVELQRKLTNAARLQPANQHVPYAFEKRVMALMAARKASNPAVFWARGLWRAAISCVVLAVLLGAVSLMTPAASRVSQDLSQDFENTLLASVDQGENVAP